MEEEAQHAPGFLLGAAQPPDNTTGTAPVSGTATWFLLQVMRFLSLPPHPRLGGIDPPLLQFKPGISTFLKAQGALEAHCLSSKRHSGT